MFSEINFRYTDAAEEKQYAPELIENAYVDIGNILEEIALPEKFLVIGQKGAGKSALSSKLQLMSQGKWDTFVETDDLEQFEFNLLLKTGGEKNGSIGGSTTTWRLLLFIKMITLLLKDQSFSINNKNISTFSESMKKHGLMASESLVRIIQQTSRKGAFFKFKAIFSESGIRADNVNETRIKDPAAIIDSIETAFLDVTPTESSFSLVLDGLDYPIKSGRANITYLGDLINAVRLVNAFMNKKNIKAKVIILIRDDVINIVPDPNLAKRINDNGVRLNWYDNTRAKFETSLMKVIENRARLAGYDMEIESLWRTWFPNRIDGRDAKSFILDNTRYLPRDLISFFRCLQHINNKPPFDRRDVLAALGNYSTWFLTELSDALVGFIPEDVRLELPGMLRELGRRFSFNDFQNKIGNFKVTEKIAPEQLAKDLFNACFIGNVWKTADHETDRFSWKYRKSSAVFDRGHDIVIHTGLWKELNLI